MRRGCEICIILTQTLKMKTRAVRHSIINSMEISIHLLFTKIKSVWPRFNPSFWHTTYRISRNQKAKFRQTVQSLSYVFLTVSSTTHKHLPVVTTYCTLVIPYLHCMACRQILKSQIMNSDGTVHICIEHKINVVCITIVTISLRISWKRISTQVFHKF